MGRNLGKAAVASPPGTGPGAQLPVRPPGTHALHEGETFGAYDCVCHAGTRSAVGTGAYPHVCVSVMLGGAFHARSSQGSALAGAGTLLLGNAGSEYAFQHVDDGGDRSVVFDYAEALVDEAARSLGIPLRAQRPFGRACIPASAATSEACVRTREALRSGGPEALEEAALFALATVLAAERGSDAGVASTHTPPQARRVAGVLRYIEAHSAADCSLTALGAQARLSSFHLLHLFRALTGQTPRQVVIATRLRRAAVALRTTRARVTDIALDVGFGDLSHFTSSFTRAFGVSPRGYRKRAPGASARR